MIAKVNQEYAKLENCVKDVNECMKDVKWVNGSECVDDYPGAKKVTFKKTEHRGANGLIYYSYEKMIEQIGSSKKLLSYPSYQKEIKNYLEKRSQNPNHPNGTIHKIESEKDDQSSEIPSKNNTDLILDYD